MANSVVSQTSLACNLNVESFCFVSEMREATIVQWFIFETARGEIF